FFLPKAFADEKRRKGFLRFLEESIHASPPGTADNGTLPENKLATSPVPRIYDSGRIESSSPSPVRSRSIWDSFPLCLHYISDDEDSTHGQGTAGRRCSPHPQVG